MDIITKILDDSNLDEDGSNMEEKHFFSLFKKELANIKENYGAIAKYACPCKRKGMSQDDYKNYNNKHTSAIWKSLHNLSFKYSDKPSDKSQKLIFNLLTQVITKIPCVECRRHYQGYIKNYDMDNICKTRVILILWLIELHNNINKRLNKEIFPYKKIFDMYDLK